MSFSAFAQSSSLGLNFCDGWPAPHVADAPADGLAAWTDSRATGDWTDPTIQTTPLPLGESGVSATWNASTLWFGGAEGDNEQALYREYLDDGGTGVRVTLTGLGQWLAANGHTAYQIRCYAPTDYGTGFQPVTIRYGAATNGPALHTMTPAALGDGGFPTHINPPGSTPRGYVDSPATLTADTITLTIPPRAGSIRGSLCALKITGSGTTATPNALTRDRWSNLGGWSVADLTTNRPRFLGLPDEILTTPADPAMPAVSEANLDDWFATRHRGFLTAPVTGWYTFWITADDEAELWLADGSVRNITSRSGKQKLAWIADTRAGTTWADPGDFDRFPSQRSRTVRLTAGQSYYLEILHKDGNGPDHLALAWQPPGQPRALLPATAVTSDAPDPSDLENDSLPDAWESAHGLNPADNGLIATTDGQYGDLDHDGLDNLTEFQMGTLPNNIDTDGDELSDKAERDFYHTNPLVSNRLEFGPATALPPQQYSATTLRWTRDPEGTLTAIERRGEISYTFTVSADPAATADLQPGVLEVSLSASAAGIPRGTEKLPLVFSIDGHRFADTTLTSLSGQTATATVLTPWLTAGPHTLTILHDNYRAELALRIHSLSLRNIGGEDLDENGRPDWLDQRLAAENHLTRSPATSLTSPVCIEGLTSYLPGLTLSRGVGVSPTPGTLGILPTDSIDGTFYANIPLDETGASTPLAVTYQSGALTETRAITWAAADLSTLTALHFRQGDSLRLDASTIGNGPDQTFGTYSVKLGDTYLLNAAGEKNHKSGIPFKATFGTPGAHTLTLIYHGNRPGRTIALTVHAADFGPALSARAHFARDWTPTHIATDALVVPDSRIAWQETTASGATARAFRVNSAVPGARHVIARLPEDITGSPGTILARGTVNTFYLAYLDETSDIAIVHTYPDGTKLMRGSIVAVGLPPDIAIRLNTYYQGTVFLNGSNQLWLTAADFDQNGIANIYFEWAGQGDPYVCTYVDLFTAP